MADKQPESQPLQVVLEAERIEIQKIRLRRGGRGEPILHGKPREAAKVPDVSIPGRKGTPADEPKWQTRDKEWREAIQKAHKANFVGLSFSGGGIRSATFNLGVLQALADLKLLYRIDYLSTVSGGGYIGGWLAAWTKRSASFKDVQEHLAARKLTSFGYTQTQLATNRVHQEDDKEPTPIRFLRVFSNYLTPKLGIFSGDTWALVAIYLRNTLLNLVIVVGMVAALLLVPRVAVRLGVWARGNNGMGWGALGLAGVLLILAFVTIVKNMEYLDYGEQRTARRWTRQGWVLALAGVPLFFDAVLGGLWLVARYPPQPAAGHFSFPQTFLDPYDPSAISGGAGAAVGAATYGFIWIVAGALAWILERHFDKRAAGSAAQTSKSQQQEKPAEGAQDLQPRRTSLGNYLIGLLGALGAGALAGWLLALLSKPAQFWSVNGALTAAVPLVLGVFLLAGAAHIGLIGAAFRDPRREWWGRLGGWLLLWGLAWAVIFWVALYFPHFIEHSTIVKTTWKEIAKKYLTPAWILTTAGSLIAGKSNASGKPGEGTWMDVVAKVGPYAFIAGLLCWVSYGISRVQSLDMLSEYRNIAGAGAWHATDTRWPFVNWLSSIAGKAAGAVLTSIGTYRLWWAIGGCLGAAAIMAWRVDINLFSMHLFYRNRLVRCYLGASNKKRSPNRFTGFDPKDDLPLKDLVADANEPYDGPYPLLNASLNLVKGKDLAWQERKAESFVMTPKHCGYDVWLEEQDSPMLRGERPLAKQEMKRPQKEEKRQSLDRFGYRPTEEYAFPSSHPGWTGPQLGLAMGISGAAASPNMGFYSSPPVAFLLTVFNVRLGQWLGNPRHRKTYKRPTPVFGLPYLVNELLGGTDDEARYVYLSDGGHFENLGLYELVKRRCGLIIVCDAEEDKDYKFAGLGNAIRKCRTDMGIDIELDVSDISPREADGPSKKHCAIGKIHYEYADVDAPMGTIIYFKASLTGDEPSDVKNYKKTKAHNSFPHESTIDQWFSESQFESYRQLGYHEVFTSIKGVATMEPKAHASFAHESMIDQWFSESQFETRRQLDYQEVFASTKSEAVSEPPPLEKQLQKILTDFGFEVSELSDASK